MNISKIMKHCGLAIFAVGLILSFNNMFDFRVFMLILGSSMYAAAVERLAEFERGSE